MELLVLLLLNIILGCAVYYHEFKQVTLEEFIISIGGGIVIFIYSLFEKVLDNTIK